MGKAVAVGAEVAMELGEDLTAALREMDVMGVDSLPPPATLADITGVKEKLLKATGRLSLEVRGRGELKGMGWFLPSGTWAVVKDEVGTEVLVNLPKPQGKAE